VHRVYSLTLVVWWLVLKAYDAGQEMSRRCHWERSPIGDSERALCFRIYSKLSVDFRH